MVKDIKKEKVLTCRISNFNIAFFAMVMGFAGAMIVAKKFEEVGAASSKGLSKLD